LIEILVLAVTIIIAKWYFKDKDEEFKRKAIGGLVAWFLLGSMGLLLVVMVYAALFGPNK
jgi:hypothetical protein